MRIYNPVIELEEPRTVSQNDTNVVNNRRNNGNPQAVVNLTRHDGVRDIDQWSERSYDFHLSDLESSDSEVTNDHNYAKPHSLLLQCDRCSYETPVRHYMNRHKKRHFNNKLNIQFNPLSKMFKCDFCSYETPTRCYMTRHKKRHVNTKLPIIKCPFCPFKTLSNGSIKAHKLTCASHIQAQRDMKSLQDIERINHLLGNETSSMDFSFGDEEDESGDFQINENSLKDNSEGMNSSFNRLLEKMKEVVDEESDSVADEVFDLELDDETSETHDTGDSNDLDVNSSATDNQTEKDNYSIDSMDNQQQDVEEEDSSIVEDTTSTKTKQSTNMVKNINAIEIVNSTSNSAENNTKGGESDPLRENIKTEHNCRSLRSKGLNITEGDIFINTSAKTKEKHKDKQFIQWSKILENNTKLEDLGKEGTLALDASDTLHNKDETLTSKPLVEPKLDRQTRLNRKYPCEVYCCDTCTYRTNVLHYIKQHVRRHTISQSNLIFQCSRCPYNSPVEYNFKKHDKRCMLKYRKKDEVAQNNESSNFSGKENSLDKTTDNHIELDKTVLTSENIDCTKSSSPNESLNNSDENQTLDISPCREMRNKTQYEVYKCDNCSYRTPIRAYLKKHNCTAKPTNKDSSNLSPIITETNIIETRFRNSRTWEIFRCNLCSYKTPMKRNLRLHDKHQHVTEKLNIKCRKCSYRTNCVDSMSKHSKRCRQSLSAWRYCNFCPYKSTKKALMLKHLRKCRRQAKIQQVRNEKTSTPEMDTVIQPKFKSVDKIVWLFCDSCSFQTTYKFNLKRHNTKCKKKKMKHCTRRQKSVKNPEQRIEIFKCTFCRYQATLKRYLTRHIKIHHQPLMKEVYVKLEPVVLENHQKTEKIEEFTQKTLIVKCNSEDLNRLRCNKALKDNVEAQFKCGFCNYRSTVKRNLTRHMKKHKTVDRRIPEVIDEKRLESVNVTALNASDFLKNFNLKLKDEKLINNEVDVTKTRESTNKDDVLNSTSEIYDQHRNLNKLDQDKLNSEKQNIRNYPNKLENSNVQIKVISSVSITVEPVNKDKEWIVELNSDVILKNPANKHRSPTEEQLNEQQVNESNVTVKNVQMSVNPDCNNSKDKSSEILRADLFLYCDKCSYRTTKKYSYKRHQRRHFKSKKRKPKFRSGKEKSQVSVLDVEKLGNKALTDQSQELQSTSELKEDKHSQLVDTSGNNLCIVSNKKSDDILENIRGNPQILRVKSPQQLIRKNWDECEIVTGLKNPEDSNINELDHNPEVPKTTVSSEQDLTLENPQNSNRVTENTLTVANSHIVQFTNRRELMSKRDIMHCLKCDECFYKMTIQNYFKSKRGKVNVEEPDPVSQITDNDEPLGSDESVSNLAEHNSTEDNSKLNEVKPTVSKKEETTPKRQKLITRNREIFKCGSCGYKTGKKFNYERHVKTHEKNNSPVAKVNKVNTREVTFESFYRSDKKSIKSLQIQCDMCEYHTSNRGYFNRHLKTTHKISSISPVFINNLLKCAVCSFVTSNLKLWEEHAHTKQKETTFECPNCSYISNVRRNFSRHLLRHKNLLKNGKRETGLASVSSGKNSTKTKDFKLHQILKCELCSYETTVPRYLKRHQKRHSFQKSNKTLQIKTEESNQDQQILQCDAPNVKTEEDDSLKPHQAQSNKKHVKPRKKLKLINLLEQKLKATYECDKCTYKSPTKANFRKHVSRHKKKSILKCSSCSYSTHSIRDLKQHKRIHPLKGLYECTKCPFFTTYISKLKRHELTHKSS